MKRLIKKQFNILLSRSFKLLILFTTILSFIQFSLSLPSNEAFASYTAPPYGNPSWWNGASTCDNTSGHNSGATNTSTWQGIEACSGGNGYNSGFGGQWPNPPGINEWQCVEMVFRYLYAAFGQTVYSLGNSNPGGKDIVNDYPANPGVSLQKISNGTQNQSPQVGDVLSFGAPPSPYNNPAGHTAIVEADQVDSNGYGYITLFQQNTSHPDQNFTVTNWAVESEYVDQNGNFNNSGNGTATGFGAVINWLHYTQGSSLIQVTGGISLSTSTPTQGGYLQASYQITNEGNQAGTYQSLRTIAIDPNGNTSVIHTDGGATLNVGQYANNPDSTNSFLADCSQCVSGTYTIKAQLEAGGVWYDIPAGTGGTNPVTASVTVSSPPSLTVTSNPPVSISPNPSTIGGNGNFTASYTVENTGGSAIAINNLDLAINDTAMTYGFNMGTYGGYQVIQPGASVTYTQTITDFGPGQGCWSCTTGSYVATPKYNSNANGNWYNLSPVQPFSVSSRVGVVDTSNNFNIKDNTLSDSWFNGELSNSSKAIAMSGTRIGAIDANGTFWAKDGGFSSSWTNELSNATAIALSGTRIGVLDNTGVFRVKDGDLSSQWVIEATDASAIALSGDLVGYIDTSGNFKVKQGSLYNQWTSELTSASAMALDEYQSNGVTTFRIGSLDTSGSYRVKQGDLSAQWTTELTNATAISLSGTRVGVIDTSGTLWVKDGDLNSQWTNELSNATAIALSGTRIGVLDNTGTLRVKDGSLSDSWVTESTAAKALALPEASSGATVN